MGSMGHLIPGCKDNPVHLLAASRTDLDWETMISPVPLHLLQRTPFLLSPVPRHAGHFLALVTGKLKFWNQGRGVYIGKPAKQTKTETRSCFPKNGAK